MSRATALILDFGGVLTTGLWDSGRGHHTMSPATLAELERLCSRLGP